MHWVSLRNDFVSSEGHIGHLHRLRLSQQAAWEARKSFENMMKTEEMADEKTALIMDYFYWNVRLCWDTLLVKISWSL